MKSHLTALLVGIMLTTIGCAGPSHGEIEAAVRNSLRAQVPGSLIGSLVPGSNPSIESVTVIQVGSAQGEGSSKWWPVKVRVKGTAQQMFSDTLGRGPTQFDKEAEFLLKKDPYGKWVAQAPSL